MQPTIEALQTEINQLREDSAYLELMAGFADSSNGFSPNLANGTIEIESLYRFNSFAGKVIDLLPDAMTQKWVLYKADLPGGVTSAIQRTLDKAASVYNEAIKAARKYGGSVILLGADDGITDYSQPVNEYNLRAVRWLNVLGKDEISPQQYNENPLSPNYGKPEIYRISGSLTSIHHSRLLRFDGTRLGNREMRRNGGWGDSVLTRPYKALQDFTKSHAGVFASLKDFNQRKLKIKQLSQQLIAKNGQEKVRARLSLIAATLSSYGIMAIDGENEDYEIVARQYGGVLEILKQAAQIFAGSCDIPPSKLLLNFNSSGLASEDTTQERAWASFVNSRQNSDILEQLEYHVRLLHLSQEGHTKGMIPDGVELTFPSLFQLSESEQQELKNKEAERIERLVKNGVITADEAAQALAQGVPLESVINLEARQKLNDSIRRFPEGFAT